MSLPENNIKNLITSIILCAGEGTRIIDLLSNKPKPLLEINGKPILSYLISHLIRLQVSSIIIVTGHLKEHIENYIKGRTQNNTVLKEKISIIDSGNDYKKGPLYSFLSVIKKEEIPKKEILYLVFPGDTIFNFDLVSEIISTINSNFSFIQVNSIVFYQKLQGSKLKKKEDPNKTISMLKTEDIGSGEVVRGIEQLELNSISENLFYKQIIPVFVFNYKFLTSIIEAEKQVNVKTIREIVNLLIKEKDVLYAYSLNPNFRFFDIDTKLDLLEINQKKEDNRRSD